MATVICPCCKGRKWLPVYDPFNPDVIDSYLCTHCQGEGMVPSEVTDGRYVLPGSGRLGT